MNECHECAYDGQCDVLHMCGGRYFRPRYETCEQCGRAIDITDEHCVHTRKHGWLCTECFDSYTEDEE